LHAPEKTPHLLVLLQEVEVRVLVEVVAPVPVVWAANLAKGDIPAVGVKQLAGIKSILYLFELSNFIDNSKTWTCLF
jgi:hypothetical protein